MQNTSNWDLEEGNSSTNGNKAHQPSGTNIAAMAAGATATMPWGASFPQPPVGFFQLNGPGVGSRNTPNTIWGMLR